MSNENKSAQLGMPFGTACGRLRKMVLFSVLKKHEENVCVRCNGAIELVDDLSIEHIKPWENVSVDLFWDLNNIAFSHIHCNVPHVYHGGKFQRKVGPLNTAWCTVCKKFEPIERFHKNKHNWNGLQSHCKEFRPDRINSAEECHSYKVEA